MDEILKGESTLYAFLTKVSQEDQYLYNVCEVNTRLQPAASQLNFTKVNCCVENVDLLFFFVQHVCTANSEGFLALKVINNTILNIIFFITYRKIKLLKRRTRPQLPTSHSGSIAYHLHNLYNCVFSHYLPSHSPVHVSTITNSSSACSVIYHQ